MPPRSSERKQTKHDDDDDDETETFYQMPIPPMLAEHDVEIDFATGRVGRGEFGVVYPLKTKSTGKETRWVVKINLLRSESCEQRFDREVDALREYADIRWKLPSAHTQPTATAAKTDEAGKGGGGECGGEMVRIVPELLDSWKHSYRKNDHKQHKILSDMHAIRENRCIPASTSRDPPKKVGVQIIERMDGSFTMLGVEQAKRFSIKDETAIALTCDQWLDLCTVPFALNAAGIVSGDLKKSNILQSHGGRVIRVCDNAFSGSLAAALATPTVTNSIGKDENESPSASSSSSSGSSKSGKSTTAKAAEVGDVTKPLIGYPSALAHKSRKFPTRLWAYMNQWQMYYDLVHNRSVYLIHGDGQSCSLIDEPTIRKKLDLPKEVVHEFHALIRSWHRKHAEREFIDPPSYVVASKPK